MKITVTLENVTPDQFRVINELFTAPAAPSHELLNAPVKVVPVAPSISPEDAALADSYNKLASPDHAKITPAAPAAPAAPEYDSSGLQYDERIHSGTKAKNKDGSWKQRRGVDDATITAVETELRGKAPAAPAAPVAPAIPDPSTMFTPPAPLSPVHADVERSIAAVTASIPPAPPAPPVPAFLANAPVVNATAPATVPATSVASVTTAPAINFGTLTQRIANGLAGGKIGADYPTTVCVRVGAHFGKQINSLTDIMNDQAMIEYADYVMTQDNAGF